MHKFLSTDEGVQCYRCGAVLDYMTQDEAGGLVADEATELAAMRYLPVCAGPSDARAHHYVYEGDGIACAYGDARIGELTPFDSIRAACIGA